MGEYQNFLVKADTERLLEVLQNIIENAIKYGSDKKNWYINFERRRLPWKIQEKFFRQKNFRTFLTASIVAPMQEARKEADWGSIYAES